MHRFALGRVDNKDEPLDWIIDPYRVERDDQGEITSDPNLDDEQYIGRVIAVSLETLRIVNSLPTINFER